MLVEITDNIAKITNDLDVWYVKRMGDTTHLYFANNLDAVNENFAAVYHVAQLKEYPYYNALREWLIKPFRQN